MCSHRGDSRLLVELSFAYQAYHRAAAKLPKSLQARASAPLLISPHSKWPTCPTKLLIVGQETNGWRSNSTSDGTLALDTLEEFASSPGGVSSMLSAYKAFDFARTYRNRNSAFWRAFRHLECNVAETPCSAMWTNLFKVDVSGSVVRNCKIKHRRLLRDAQSGLLAEEIRFLKPRIVVFFTGPHYDYELLDAFSDAALTPLLPNRDGRETALIHSAALPVCSIRTYHPTFLQRSRRWELLDEVSRAIRTMKTKGRI
jgi:hypothetical protein